MTEEGVTEAEQLLGVDNLYDPRNILLLHHVNQALQARTRCSSATSITW